MKHTETVIKSPCDQLPLSVLTVLPDAPETAVGIVQLVHGMAEHKERYIGFMRFLADHGYISVIHDHRGHGLSVRRASDFGYFYGAGADGLIEDTAAVTQYIKESRPDLPVFLLGHSMGSLVVRAYTKRYDDQISGLIVIGSPSKKSGARIGLLLTKLIRLLRGDRHVSLLVDRMAAPRAKTPDSCSKAAWICSVKSVVQAYDLDPRCGFTFTADGFEGLIELMIDVYDKSGWQLKRPSLPVHFASGAEDICLIDEKHFKHAVDFMRKMGYQNVTAKLYSGLRHEILNEKDKDLVFDDLLAVLNTMNGKSV